jgi:hypothetical protein
MKLHPFPKRLGRLLARALGNSKHNCRQHHDHVLRYIWHNRSMHTALGSPSWRISVWAETRWNIEDLVVLKDLLHSPPVRQPWK